LRDRLLDIIRGGHPSEEDVQNGLVSYLQSRLSANSTDSVLTITADWQDPQMASRIVAAAQEIFLESRHVAEISTIQEKITILDGHAVKLRQEIDTMAEQLQHIREDRLAEAGKAAKDLESAVAAPTGAPAPAAPRRVARTAAEADADLPRLKEELEQKKHALGEIEGDRKRRLLDARARLAELQPKFTEAHPAVRLAAQYVDSLVHPSEQATALEADIATLTSEIKHREGTKSESSSGSAGSAPAAAAPAASAAELLPSKVMKLLDEGVGVDPAVNAQLQSAITKYASLRDSIRSARIELDTAQAAFNHRYKVIEPPEPPSKPSKPKVPLLLAGGLIASLFLALAIPVLAELRSGIMVERWQVNQIKLPILAELPFPGRSSE
jgi:DNA repair exonuclease SbcCD ATPase subunit